MPELVPHAFPVECPSRIPEEIPDDPKDEEPSEREPNGQKSSAHFGGYLAMALSFLLAFFLMIGAFCGLPEPLTLEGDSTDASDDTEKTAQKVVYVQGYGEGGLSTPELYDACIASVVSITTFDGQHAGVGSGFVLREDGYIATAQHVIADAERVEVVLFDGKRYEACVVGSDALTDLALLKIDVTGLSPVTFASSGDLLTGERVVAIGTPASLDYAGSVSSGEISCVSRSVKIFDQASGTLEKKMTLIQTNAPVNPGNSGCPLFDGNGQVVGMITMKLGENFSGIGFAVPSDGVLAILDAMQTGEELSDSLLALVSVRAATLSLEGEAYETGGVYGVRITKFSSENAGAQKTLRVGDMITHIGDETVTRASDVESVLRAYAPGDTVAVSVLRNGQCLTFEIVLDAKR